MISNNEVKHQLKHAENKLNTELEDNFYEIIKAVQHKRGGYYLINKMYTFVNDMIHHGQIESKEAKYFIHELNKQTRNLNLNKLDISFEEAELDFQKHWELAKIFSTDQLDGIYKHFKEQNFDSGDTIIKKGSNIKHLIYISKGVVHEKNGEINDPEAPKIKNKAGDILGLQFLTNDERPSFTNWYAKTICRCWIFPISDLRRLLTSIDQEKKIWIYVGPSVIQLNPDLFTRLQHLDSLQIKLLLKNSDYWGYDKGEKIELKNGGILFEGTLEELTDKNEENAEDNSLMSESEKGFDNRIIKIKAFAFIYPTDDTYVAKEEVRIFHFPEVLKDSWLSFNQQVFDDAFSVLPGAAATLQRQGTIRDRQNTLIKKQKTTLLGLPKGLAHNDPVQTFRQGRRGSISDRYSYGLSQNMQGQIGEGTIMPKGYTKPLNKSSNDEERHHPIHRHMTEIHKNQEETKMKTKENLENSREEYDASEESERPSLNKSIKEKEIKLRVINPDLESATENNKSTPSKQSEYSEDSESLREVDEEEE